ncbi:hypothetical protein H2248_008180 [Termitomyces sp. 'cryptogamus']|nr:hypothetical protein H2248_008180 [Termitomyces sp. 'cryptogamus']
MRVQLNGFSAWITINDMEQTSHSIEYSPDGSLATCWIVSEAGKNFSVHWQDLQHTYSSHGRVFVDGMGGHGAVLDPSIRLHTTSKNGFRTSRETKRLFMFSESELTDDDQYLHTETMDLGTIKLEIWRCKITYPSRTPSNRVRVFSDPQKIHERSKKGLGHRCKLGPDIHDVKKSACQSKDFDKIATFQFKYRPLAHLQANGILPLNQNRKRAAESRDEGALQAQRIRTLRAELRQLENRQRKRPKHDKVDPGTEDVKVEAGGHSDFIDLT